MLQLRGGFIFEDLDLDCLGLPFSEDEVRKAINQMPKDKAPEQDGFNSAFFKRCWETIKTDLINVIHLFGSLH
jgi:hypothetical protein